MFVVPLVASPQPDGQDGLDLGEFLSVVGPDAAGLKIQYGEQTLTVITSRAPLGQMLLGKQPGDEVEILRVETKEYQYLYEDGDDLVVMDNSTYEQFNVPKFLFGNAFTICSSRIVIKPA